MEFTVKKTNDGRFAVVRVFPKDGPEYGDVQATIRENKSTTTLLWDSIYPHLVINMLVNTSEQNIKTVFRRLGLIVESE